MKYHALNMGILDALIEQLETGTYKPTTRDADRMLRLEYYLRGLDPRRKRNVIRQDPHTGKFTQ
jgi:hypothetical protein